MVAGGLFVFVLAYICVICADTRAVNISNTWVLPEEGFPVFYRYFRDRISWYEADAVCQFHHANLVTVDSTRQFDALRAYLKELDIMSNVWIGLSKSSDRSRFYWPSGQDLSSEGYWGGALPASGEALCALTDPAADFRWQALNCGGPEVASFVCELPVPPWASGDDGCMLTSLPSLTIIFLPEQTAVELTSDCGLDGTKRIACKGKADHEEMMRQLSCGITHEDFEEKAVSRAPAQTSVSTETKTTIRPAATKPWIWTSNTVDTGEYGFPTRHRRETEDTLSTGSEVSAVTTEVRKATVRIQPQTTASSVSSTTPVLTTAAPASTEPLTRKEDRSTTTPHSTTDTETQTEFSDFPSSINQGQLFSIIENGTMFDIIEVNDSSTGFYPVVPHSDELDKQTKTRPIASATTSRATPNTVLPRASAFTTLSTPRAVKTTETSAHNADKTSVNKHQAKTANDLVAGEPEKTFSKVMEEFPDDNSLVKLNRTNRKELPMLDYRTTDEPTTTKKTDQNGHRVVEITISNSPKRADGAKFYITTKKYEKNKSGNKYSKVIEEKKTINKVDSTSKGDDKNNFTADYNINIEISELSKDNITDLNGTVKESVEITIIDPKMDANRTSETKIGEDVTDVLLSGARDHQDDVKQEVDEAMDFEEIEKKEPSAATEEPIQPVPEEQPRPNRNRVLTRPQRRSFYPYFFSRVLG